MSNTHEALKLADWLAGMVCIHPQSSEDDPGGYATEYDQKVDEGRLTILAQHALIVQMAEHADPDASECESCVGQGWYWQEHQVAERATDVQTFKTDCEACSGIGFVGPDAEFKRALAAATQYLTRGPKP